MKRSVTAVIIVLVTLACIAGLALWRGTGAGVALADVLTQIRQVSVYMYQMTITTTGVVIGDEPMNHEMHATTLISQDLSMKVTMDMGIDDPTTGEPMVQEMYVLPQQKKMISLMHGQKKYMEMAHDDTEFEEMRKENNDPSAMLEQILACNYTNLGRSTVDGIEVEGFQSTDPNYLGGMAGEVDIKIWVDVKTQLPVRWEMDMEMGAEMGLGGDMHTHLVMHDFQWDVSVDASEFELVIPDDYTPITDEPVKMLAMDEDSAMEGLKRFAEFGTYPEKLDLMTLMSQVTEVATKDLPTAKELRDRGEEPDREARTQEMVEAMMPIQSLGMFYMLLVQEQKDPAYYGDTVAPEDKDQVLLRWKVSETEYRVIFGDLHVETVTADTLAELEKNLPK